MNVKTREDILSRIIKIHNVKVAKKHLDVQLGVVDLIHIYRNDEDAMKYILTLFILSHPTKIKLEKERLMIAKDRNENGKNTGSI